MPREHHNDTPPPATRARVRAVTFLRHGGAPTTPEQLEILDTALDGLGGDWARARHGAYTGCTACAGADPHDQGVMKFANPRDLCAVTEALPPGFVVRPLTGRGAFPKAVEYLRHNGAHDLFASFEIGTMTASIPRPKPPTLKELERLLFDGAMTTHEAATRYPDMYVRHARKLASAAQLGVDHRAETARRAERAAGEAEARARADAARRAAAAERAAMRAWLNAEDAWLASPECAEQQAQEAAEKAARAAQAAADEAARAAAHARAQEAAEKVERTQWALALCAADIGITGDADDRRGALGERLGAEPTFDALADFMVADDWYNDAGDFAEQVDAFRADVRNQNVGTFGAYMAAPGSGDDADAAYRYLLKQRDLHARWPDLYEAVVLHPNHRRHWAHSDRFDALVTSEALEAAPTDTDTDRRTA